MNETLAVLIPLLNPNEQEVVIAALHVIERQPVARGEVICTIETTKSAADIEAERDGFVVNLRYNQGDTTLAGNILCYLADSQTWTPPNDTVVSIEAGVRDQASPQSRNDLPDGLRITKPALRLANKHGLDLGELPNNRLVTEKDVHNILKERQPTHDPYRKELSMDEYSFPQKAINSQAIIVYGGGGHGKALVDLLRALRIYRIVGIVDDGIDSNETIMGIPVLGGGEILNELHKKGVRQAINAVGGIGDMSIRSKVFQQLAVASFVCPAVAHPTAFVEPSASLSGGCQIFPHAYVGSESFVGYGAIVNTGAIVSHGCILDDYANISPGAILAGNVHIGKSTLIGMGVTVNLGVTIGIGARVGNGSTIKTDVPDNGIVRAGTSWPD
ncbi:NeuD/PglB/VioB family sugar acetyltransferase [Chloroflexota bacterium]